MIAAFEKFKNAIDGIEEDIAKRNADPNAGPAVNPDRGGMPYTLLAPSSAKGVTGRGVPYSISI